MTQGGQHHGDPDGTTIPQVVADIPPSHSSFHKGAAVSIAEAASSGSRVQALMALRDRLATDLDECKSARDVAALSQRLMDVLGQLDRRTVVEVTPAEDSPKEVNPLDELKRRRAAREANAAG